MKQAAQSDDEEKENAKDWPTLAHDVNTIIQNSIDSIYNSALF